MKKTILLTAIALSVFSCTEYSDDGTPGGEVSQDDGISGLPDSGLKKIKKEVISLDVTTSISALGQGFSMTTTGSGESNYAENELSADGFISVTTEYPDSGLPVSGDVVITTSFQVQKSQLYPVSLETTQESVFQGQTQTAQSTTNYTFEDYLVTAVEYLYNPAIENNASTTYTHSGQTSTVNSSSNFTDENGTEVTRTTSNQFNFNDEGKLESATISCTENGTSVSYDVAFTYTGEVLTSFVISRDDFTQTIGLSYDDKVSPKYMGYSNNVNANKSAQIIPFANLAVTTNYNAATTNERVNLTNAQYLHSMLTPTMSLWSPNNLNELTVDGEQVQEYSYEYDSDNYPTKITITSPFYDGLPLSFLEGLEMTYEVEAVQVTDITYY